MVESAKKHSLVKKVLLGVVIFVAVLLGALYWIVSSPQFLNRMVDRLNSAIPGEVVYQNLNLSLEGRRISAQDLKYINGEGQTALGLDRLELKFALSTLLRGRLELLDLNVTGLAVHTALFPKKEGPSRWRAVLKFILGRLTIETSQIKNLDLFLKKGGQIRAEEIQLKITKAILGAQQLHVDLNELKMLGLGPALTAQQGGIHTSFKLPITKDFDFFVKQAKGNLKLNNIKLPKLNLENFKSEFKIDGNKIALPQGQIRNEHGTLDLALRYSPKDEGLNLKLKNETPISFAAIPKASKRLQNTFTGWMIDLELNLQKFSLQDFTGSIDLTAKTKGNARLDNTPDHQLELEGKLNQGVLNFTLLEIRSEKMELQGEGTIDLAKQNFDVTAETRDFDITTLVNTLADIDLKGYANATGTITGSFKNPKMVFEATADETGYSFMNFGKTEGLFQIVDGTLSYEGRAPDGEANETRVDVKVTDLFNKLKRTTVLKSSFKNIAANSLLLNEEFQGKVSGLYNMEALPGSVETGELQAQIIDFVVYDFHFDKITALGKLTNNQFILDPVSFQAPDQDPITAATPITFSFDKQGWTMDGKLLPGLALSGGFQNNRPTQVKVKAEINNVNLQPVLASMLLPAEESYADGEVVMAIGLDENPSSIDLKFSKLELPLEEGQVQNDGTIEVEIRPPSVHFKQVKLKSGEGDFDIQGTYTLDGPMDLQMEGKLNLGLLALAPQYFRGGEGYADFNLKARGPLHQPNLLGTVDFSNASVTLRPVRADLENLNGQISFTPNAIIFNQLGSIVREGDLRLQGEIKLQNHRPSFYDLEIATREVAISNPGTYKLVFSGDFTLKGPKNAALLRGTADINDGVYSRDFNIAESLLKPSTSELQQDTPSFLKNIKLDLNVRSPGELAIRNNIANINFNADLRITGAATQPKIRGALEVLNGIFHYFTVDFEDARGTIDFRGNKKGPYVDIVLQKDYSSTVDNIVVEVFIQGFSDNLQVTFNSNPPLERKDILALVFTGALPGDTRRNLTGTNLAATVIASQLSQVLQKPLERTAKLDIFRLEPSTENSNTFSSLVVGKKLTDRLSLEFKTDLGVDRPLQGVQMEYLLLDNVLIKGTQFNDGEFDFDLAYRIRLF